jgi:hypothetical protein
MVLPYDYSLSHHQLLFNVFIIVYSHKYGKIFTIKASRMIFLQSKLIGLVVIWVK